ncbi:uncharacterized protein EKO05_0007249 [Ascochyta rabiei]|nr:uncharacterized protein EKO05_0007249 [Ascochyta rabiei]UPX16866.1 hypothetical protein EKO05_0007249 [Ascochyta rabiei]
MLPTLQQKLRIWTIRESRAQHDAQATSGLDVPVADPAGVRQPPEVVPEEFHRHQVGHRDSSPTDPDPPSIDQSQDRPVTEARGPNFDVAEALLRSLDGRVGAPTNLANEAAQGDSAFALDTPAILADFVKQVQQRDVLYPGKLSLTTGTDGGAKKAQHHWEVDPSGTLRRSGKV